METPRLFDLLVLLLWHECLRWHERGARPWAAILALLLLMSAWARLNGETLAGLSVLAAYWLGATIELLHAGTAPEQATAKKKIIRLSCAAILCVGAAWLHPDGYQPLRENIRLLFRNLPQNWPGGYGSLNFQSVVARGFLGWLAALFLFLVWQRPRLTPGAGLVLVSWVGLACYAQRYIPFMVILTVPILAASAGRKWGWGWAVLAVEVLSAGLPRTTAPVPAAAVQYIREQPAEFGGRIFNHHTWSAYLAKEWPEQRRFIEGADSISGYQQIANLGTNWLALLERSDVGWTLLPCRHCLNQGLRELANWRCAYSDEVAVVYRKLP